MSTVTETFYIVFRKGIEGGCPPPEPRALYLISRATWSEIFMISAKRREEGDDTLKLVVSRSLKVAEHAESISRFQQLMAELPTQYCGVEDLYGRDTSIVHVTDYLRMPELHLSGSEAPKVPRPTEEQKVKFDEAVAIVERWCAVRPW